MKAAHLIFRFALSVALGFVPAVSYAGSSTVSGKNAAGSTINWDTTTDASLNNVPWLVICDFSAAANCASVDAGHGLFVGGEAASGAAVTGNPVLVGGSDGTDARALSMDNQGRPNVHSLVTGNAGNVLDFSGQNATTPNSAFLMGGSFNTTPTTITTGHSSPLQLDSAGNLLVNLNAGTGATAALQGTNSATTSHTCSTAGYSILGCLGQVDDDVKSSIAAGTNVIGFTSNDPCSQATKLGAAINLTASGQVITGTASKKTYICSLDLISATAQNIALVEGTGTTCATNIFGLAGGTTAATGWNLAANGGLTKGSGAGTVYSPSADVNATAANVCLLLSSTGQTSGQITYVQQ